MNNKQYPPIILASGSPRRSALLQQIDIPFKVIKSNVDENFDIGLSPINFVKHYARLKAEAVAKSNLDAIVIGADTIVVLDDIIIGKPKNKEYSEAMLQKLSGRTHTVITGVALIWKEKNIKTVFSAKTKVTFRNLNEEQIQYYINNYNPFDKAGSYGIQDWFAVCVKKIDGCFYNVMGFPLSKFYKYFTNIING